jgi:hypothetical protein
MSASGWITLTAFSVNNASVHGLWLPVTDLLPAKRLIKLQASGNWACFGRAVPTCGPEGYLDYGVPPDQLMVADSPTGALIGKIGGSTAGRSKDGTLFPIGTLCVLSPLEKAVPLFVAVNGGGRGGAYEFADLRIDIFHAEAVASTATA